MPATVVGLGFVSLFTDMSTEMVNAVLPLYLVYAVGIGYAQLGAIDGLYTGATALLRLAGGHVADRIGRPKAVAAVGYGLSAVSKLGFPLAGVSVMGIGAALAADRVGKGIRTAPRDAMITLAAPSAVLGRAFGVHRAMDTAGALLGPVLAFVLIGWLATGYDAVFTTSFSLGLISLIILIWWVPQKRAPRPNRNQIGLRAALALLQQARLRRAAIAAALLGCCTIGDMFLYLALQQRTGLPPSALPLLPLGSALVFMAAATPLGRVGDRFGRWRVFLAGHLLLVLVYLVAIGAAGWVAAAVMLAGHGLFYAATDGVLMAFAGPLVPQQLRATGLALVQTVQALSRAVGAVAFGLVAHVAGVRPAFALFAGALLICLVLAARLGHRENP